MAKKPNGYWNYEKCFNCAKECEGMSEFAKKYKSAYTISRRKGWIDDFIWLNPLQHKSKPQNYWNYQNCYEEAKKYNKRSEFMFGNSYAYDIARKNKWLDDYVWFQQCSKPLGYWNEQTCRDAAMKCETKKEFRTKYGAAYNVSRKNGWLVQYTWLKSSPSPYKENIDNVYCYIFEETHSVYVGRTIQPEERDKQHRMSGSVYNYSQSNNIDIPQMTLLMRDLSINDGQYYEDFYIQKYINDGWNVINKAKTGVGIGALGAIGYDKWNKNTCYELAKTCKTISEFSQKSSRAYSIAKQNGWSYDWFVEKKKPSGYWTYETCMEVARDCKTRNELKHKYKSAYDIARKNKWLDDYYWLEDAKRKNGHWLSYENCYKAAKTCKNKNEFYTKYSGAYHIACKNSWLKDYTWFEEIKKPNGYWTYEVCQKYAKQCKTRSEFNSKFPFAYKISKKNNWIDDFLPRIK